MTWQRCEFLLLLVLTGCGHEAAPPPAAPLSQAEVTYRVVESVMCGVYGVELFEIINTEQEWKDLQARLETSDGLTMAPGPPAPEGITWGTENVLLIATGETGMQAPLRSAG
jgi:hypothetical protein